MGRVSAEFQAPVEVEEALDALRRREWECLERRAAGRAVPGELRAARLALARGLAGAGRAPAAARLAAELLHDDPPEERALRAELAALALAHGAASEFDARERALTESGLLDDELRLELAEDWLATSALAAAERVLAPFRAPSAAPNAAATALRARLALAAGRAIAARALLAELARDPAPAGARGALALLLGAEHAREDGELARAEELLAAIRADALPSSVERARLAALRAALARFRGELDRAARCLAEVGAESEAEAQACLAIEAAHLAVARGAAAEAEALAQRAAELFGERAALEPALFGLRGAVAFARGEHDAARAALERALERGRWSGAGIAGEALETWAALACARGWDPQRAATWLGLPARAPSGLEIELVLCGPRRAFLVRCGEGGLFLRELDAEERGSRGPGARVIEVAVEAAALAAEPTASPPAFAIALDAAALSAVLAERDPAFEDGRDFLGFGRSPNAVSAVGATTELLDVEEELRAVAQCFPSAEQHLHLGLEATLERLRAAARRGEPGLRERRYRVLHLVALARAGAAAAELQILDAEDRSATLDLARLEEADRSPLPLADLCVLSLLAASEAEADALRRSQLEPWVHVLLARGARAVLIGVRTFTRDDAARRELGLFYDALAAGESASRAAARARDLGAEAVGNAPSVPIFTLYGDGALRARGWAPPDLAILAPEAMRRPWWVYFVTALILPVLVFLVFRRLSTPRLHARA